MKAYEIYDGGIFCKTSVVGVKCKNIQQIIRFWFKKLFLVQVNLH